MIWNYLIICRIWFKINTMKFITKIRWLLYLTLSFSVINNDMEMSMNISDENRHQQHDDNELLNSDILQEKSFVALCYSSKTLGIACYNDALNVIYTDSIPVSSTDINNILINLKIKLSPTLFIIHPTLISNKAMLDLILCSADGMHRDYYKYTSLKSSCWSSETSLDFICAKLHVKKLYQLHSTSSLSSSSSLPFNSGGHHIAYPSSYVDANHNNINSMHRQQSSLPASSTSFNTYSLPSTSHHPCQRNHQIQSNYLLLSAVIDLENTQVKSSLSALLTFMTNNLFNLDNGVVTVSNIQSLAIADYLKMDDLTYRYVWLTNKLFKRCWVFQLCIHSNNRFYISLFIYYRLHKLLLHMYVVPCKSLLKRSIQTSFARQAKTKKVGPFSLFIHLFFHSLTMHSLILMKNSPTLTMLSFSPQVSRSLHCSIALARSWADSNSSM